MMMVGLSASADTIAWWHFDECEPGTTAPANTVASDQAPTTYAHVYTVGDSGAMSALHENEGDYLPTYTKPFRGLAVYDPVTDTTRTNRAAMKFRVDRGGPNPDTNAGRARFGGALKFDGGYNLYQPLYGTSALTIEAFSAPPAACTISSPPSSVALAAQVGPPSVSRSSCEMTAPLPSALRQVAEPLSGMMAMEEVKPR